MPLNPLNIVSLAGSGLKTGFSLFQGLQGMKQQRDLWNNRPILSASPEEGQILNSLSQQANATEMPGQRAYENKMNQAYGEGVYDVQRSSPSSLNATQGAIDLASKRIQATQDLAGQFAEWKAKRQDALNQGRQWKVGQDEMRWDVNQYQPWNIKMNEATANKVAGFGGAMSGLDTGFGMLNDLQGTQAMMDMFKKMYPNLGGGVGIGNSFNANKFLGDMIANASRVTR